MNGRWRWKLYSVLLEPEREVSLLPVSQLMIHRCTVHRGYGSHNYASNVY